MCVVCWQTAMLYPSLLCGCCFVLNFFIMAKGSSGAVSAFCPISPKKSGDRLTNLNSSQSLQFYSVKYRLDTSADSRRLNGSTGPVSAATSYSRGDRSNEIRPAPQIQTRTPGRLSSGKAHKSCVGTPVPKKIAGGHCKMSYRVVLNCVFFYVVWFFFSFERSAVMTAS